MTKIFIHTILIILVTIGSVDSYAQKPGNILRGIGNRIPTGGGGLGSTGGSDSIKARNKFEDSVTVNIYYLDSAGSYKEDSSINDFTARFPIPSSHIYLGNTGSATRSILFSPLLKARSNERFGGRLKDKGCWTTHEVQQVRVDVGLGKKAGRLYLVTRSNGVRRLQKD